MLFHKSGPLIGQPRADVALTKLHGKQIGTKMIVVRLAKNLNYDDLDKPKPKVTIPVLAAGSSTREPLKISKEITIQAIEAKLKMLESKADDLEINKTRLDEVPLIHKYQFNKNNSTDLKS
ncbi:putative RNA-binding protein 18, partial [Pseudolycoriella hygida]